MLLNWENIICHFAKYISLLKIKFNEDNLAEEYFILDSD